MSTNQESRQGWVTQMLNGILKLKSTRMDEPEGLGCNNAQYNSECTNCKQHIGPTLETC